MCSMANPASASEERSSASVRNRRSAVDRRFSPSEKVWRIVKLTTPSATESTSVTDVTVRPSGSGISRRESAGFQRSQPRARGVAGVEGQPAAGDQGPVQVGQYQAPFLIGAEELGDVDGNKREVERGD